MKNIPYQQNAVNELTDKTIRLLNLGGKRHKIVFEAPTGAGKTVMTCQALANITDELKERGDSRYQEVAYIWFAPRKLHLQSYASLKNAFGETRKLRPVMFDEIDQSEGIQTRLTRVKAYNPEKYCLSTGKASTRKAMLWFAKTKALLLCMKLPDEHKKNTICPLLPS